eukprot:scaffold318_cov269-Pinguiococcus_pyrenoidosus.AAC.10
MYTSTAVMLPCRLRQSRSATSSAHGGKRCEAGADARSVLLRSGVPSTAAKSQHPQGDADVATDFAMPRLAGRCSLRKFEAFASSFTRASEREPREGEEDFHTICLRGGSS